MNKTMVYVIVMTYGVVMLCPVIIGNTVMFNRHDGILEHDGDKGSKKFKFDRYKRIGADVARAIVDIAFDEGDPISELIMEGVSEMPVSGNTEWNNGKEKWELTW